MTRTCTSGGFSMAIASSRRHKSAFSRSGSPRSGPKCSHSLPPRAAGPSNVASYKTTTPARYRRRKGSYNNSVEWVVSVARVVSCVHTAFSVHSSQLRPRSLRTDYLELVWENICSYFPAFASMSHKQQAAGPLVGTICAAFLYHSVHCRGSPRSPGKINGNPPLKKI